LFAHDLRANAFAFVARENRYTLFRIMRWRASNPLRYRLIRRAENALATHNPATTGKMTDVSPV